MAKFITVTHGEDYNSASTNYEALFIETATKSTTVCTDTMTGDQIIFKGRNLKYEDGRINSGTIDKMILAEDEGNPLQTFSGLNLNPGIVAGASMYEFASDIAIRAVLSNLKVFGTSGDDSFVTNKGNDRIFGRGGDDTLSAGTGRDQLTGGAGLDTFVFTTGQGRDTIMDFDADGGLGNQDHIDGTFPGGANVTQSGQDTIVDFGGGDIFVLKNVLATHIDVNDFI
jgi:Ca2+-binding RTX toxin-like protein